MAQFTRYVQKEFGDLVGAAGNFGIFGSLAAGTPQYSKDPKVIQSLDAWRLAWAAATVGTKSPALEDMNSLFYVAFYQLAYLMQTGVPAWNADTTYYQNQFCSSGGKIYKSLVNDNLNVEVSNTNNWVEYVASVLPTRSYTKNYFFETPVVVLESTGASGSFASVDIADQIAAAGLNVAGITVQSATIRCDTQLGPGGFGQYTATLELVVWGNTNGNGLKSYTRMTADDSNTSGADMCAGNCPLFGGALLHYKISNTGNATGRISRITLLGFTYEQTA